MEMFIRTIFLYLNYLRYKIQYHNHILFRGFAVIYASKNSFIKIDVTGKKLYIFSHPFSNMIGLSQRCIIVAKNGGKIFLGDGVCMSGCTIYAVNSISVGRCTDIGSGCKIIDNDFHPLPYSKRSPEKTEYVKSRPIKIGEGCFIGANSFILKGTTLGKNCVVGAGSVVSGTWPDNSIIAGNPARKIKNNEE